MVEENQKEGTEGELGLLLKPTDDCCCYGLKSQEGLEWGRMEEWRGQEETARRTVSQSVWYTTLGTLYST